MRRIALYGGTFDPLHIGHVRLAAHVAGMDGIDEVWFMPSRRNPLKPGHAVASDSERLEMCRRAAADMDGVSVTDIEMHMPEPSYTIHTLRALSARHPDCRFTPVVGADNWQCIDQWFLHDEIIDRYGLLVYPRPRVNMPADGAWPDGVTYLADAPQTDISSTHLRARLSEGFIDTRLIPIPVADWLRNRNPYLSR